MLSLVALALSSIQILMFALILDWDCLLIAVYLDVFDGLIIYKLNIICSKTIPLQMSRYVTEVTHPLF